MKYFSPSFVRAVTRTAALLLCLCTRAVQVLVVIPALLIALVMTGSAITGGKPVHALVTSLVQTADIDFRQAPAGKVFVTECVSRIAASEDQRMFSPECQRYERMELTVKEAVNRYEATIVANYVMLAALSAFFMGCAFALGLTPNGFLGAPRGDDGFFAPLGRSGFSQKESSV